MKLSKKQKPFKCQIQLDVWNHWFACFTRCTEQEALNIVHKDFGLEKIDVEDSLYNSAGRCHIYHRSGHMLMWLQYPVKLSVLVHECFHIAHHILKRKGLKLSDDSEEAYAYTQESILKELLTIFKKHKIKVRYE